MPGIPLPLASGETKCVPKNAKKDNKTVQVAHKINPQKGPPKEAREERDYNFSMKNSLNEDLEDHR
jgi:hypothetical protein